MLSTSSSTSSFTAMATMAGIVVYDEEQVVVVPEQQPPNEEEEEEPAGGGGINNSSLSPSLPAMRTRSFKLKLKDHDVVPVEQQQQQQEQQEEAPLGSLSSVALSPLLSSPQQHPTTTAASTTVTTATILQQPTTLRIRSGSNISLPSLCETQPTLHHHDTPPPRPPPPNYTGSRASSASRASSGSNSGNGLIGGRTSYNTARSSNSSSTRRETNDNYDNDDDDDEDDGTKTITSNANSKISYYSNGREFYDDGYYSDENNNSDNNSEASVNDQLNFSSNMNNLQILKGRQMKLQLLQDIYWNICSSTNTKHDKKSSKSSKSSSKQRKGTPTTTRTSTTTSAVAIIRGVSGTGKSTLVKQFVEELMIQSQQQLQPSKSGEQEKEKSSSTTTATTTTTTTATTSKQSSSLSLSQSKLPSLPSPPHFISGKYDELSGGDPFSAIVEAISEFARSLLNELEESENNNNNNENNNHNNNHDNELQRIRNEIDTMELGDKERTILTSMIPTLKPILFPTTTTTTTTGGGGGGEGDTSRTTITTTTATTATTTNGGIPPATTTMTTSKETVATTTTTTTKTTPNRKNNKNNNNNILNKGTTSNTNENAFNRLRYIFQTFIKTISTKQRPIIMFLDDLQWCDGPSLDLIHALLTDVELQYFMFIGAYRSDEVHNNTNGNGNGLLSKLNEINQIQTITEIELLNLSFKELKEFVFHVLNKSSGIQNDDNYYKEEQEAEIDNNNKDNNETKNHHHENHDDHHEDDDDDIQTLVKVLHRKTSGNIFFAMQVLEELTRKGILLFSRMTFEWECNLTNVNLDELLSDDVIATVTSKIISAPLLLQRVLIIAAYTRSTVDIETIQKLLLSLDGHSITTEELEQLLDQAVVDGLLSNNTGSKNYSFSHDRIQQASYEMIPHGPLRDEFRLHIGRRLYDMATLSESENSNDGSGGGGGGGEDWMLFVAAEHLNATSLHLQLQEDDPLFLTKMNLKVGGRAMTSAAYEVASKFLGFGMSSLLQSVKDPWTNHYDITLQLYQAIASVELCQGHFEMGQGIGNRVLQHAKTAVDKLPTHVSLAKALGRVREHRNSFELSAAALRELRAYPKGFISLNVSLVRDLLYVRGYFQKNLDEEILSLPFMTDTTKATVMELHSSFAYQAYMCGKQIDFLETTLKQLRMTFKHGICPYSSVSLVWYCLVLDTMNDMKSVYRVKDLACRMLERTKAKELEGLLLFLITYFITSWKDPHNEVLAVYRRAGKSGMESGDFENGLLNSMASYYYEFLSGFPLAQLDIKYSILHDKLKMYRVESMDVMAVQMWLLIQHLRGSAQSPLDFDELEQFGFIKTDGSENYKVLYGYMTRVQLGVYFGNSTFAEKTMELLAQTDLMDTSYPVKSVQLFFGSLIYATRGRETKRKSYLRKSKKFSQELKSFYKTKGMKGWHRYLLAEAHRRASKGKSGSTIQSSYDDAITSALQSGHNQDAALGAQLCAEYFLSMKDDTTLSNISALAQTRDSLIHQYLKQARDLYLDWGARGMVKHLEKKHATYLTKSTRVDDDLSSAVVSGECDQRTFYSNSNSIDRGSLPSLPKSVSRSEEVRPRDDFSVLTDPDQSAWRASKESANPHTLLECVV